MDLGNTIKNLRLQKGLKQNSFAAQCDITPAYLSKIENNLKEPNMSTLKEISLHLGVPLPILFFLSMDQADVQPHKRKAFEMLAPSIRSMISEFFINSTAKNG